MKQQIGTDVRRTSLSHYSLITMQGYLLQPGFHMVRGTSSAAFHDVIKAHGLSQPHLRGALITADVQEKHFARETDLISVEPFLAMEYVVDHSVLEEYIATLLQYDFLVIDATKDLLRAPSYGHFEQLLIDYHFYDAIPVIMSFRN